MDQQLWNLAAVAADSACPDGLKGMFQGIDFSNYGSLAGHLLLRSSGQAHAGVTTSAEGSRSSCSFSSRTPQAPFLEWTVAKGLQRSMSSCSQMA